MTKNEEYKLCMKNETYEEEKRNTLWISKESQIKEFSHKNKM